MKKLKLLPKKKSEESELTPEELREIKRTIREAISIMSGKNVSAKTELKIVSTEEENNEYDD